MIKEKLAAIVTGTPERIAIVAENRHYLLVEYYLAGVRCTAELIKR